MLLCTYRSDEVQPALRHLLTALQRQRLALDLPLTPLTPPQIEAMIRAIFAHPQAVRSEFLATLHTLTDGNPFFVEEVLKALVSTGDIFYADGLWTLYHAGADRRLGSREGASGGRSLTRTAADTLYVYPLGCA